MKKAILLKKRLTALLAIICMMATITPANLAMAEGIPKSGQMGDNVFWAVDSNHILNITGTGPTWNYENPWSYQDWKFVHVSGIEISSGVTSIGDCLLADFESATYVDIPGTITDIGSNGFWHCTSLTSINLPSKISTIKEFTFGSCFSLTTITIPNSVTKIEYYAFDSCPLTDVYYAGTKAQWDKIQIDYSDNGNDALLSATIHYGAVESSSPSAWAKAEVDAAIQAGLVPTNLQQNYQNPISRGDVAGMFVNLIEKTSGKSIDAVMEEKGVSINPNAFTDTTDKAVLAANALGIINGTGNGKFSPDSTLTRAQIAAIINRVATVLGVNTAGYSHQFTDVSGHWVSSELGWPSSVGIINGVGDNKFSPDTELTTEQAIAITYRAFNTLAKP